VLQGGRIVGVWSHQTAGNGIALDVELFRRAAPSLRAAIAAEADAVGAFLGARSTVRFTST
jgi:winged helix DNA-binding protein